MKGSLLITIGLGAGTLLVDGCLDPYNPPASNMNVNYLVVEGNLNSNGQTQIKLSRTSPLNADSVVSIETGALVQIEGDDGSIFSLTGDNSGNYAMPTTAIDSTRRFRLKIATSDNQKYASEFVPIKQAPPIDTIDYTVTGNDIQFYLSTHDNQNKTRYYLWKYVETWAYSSRYPSEYVFQNGLVEPRHDRTDIFNCWSTINSSQILIGSSAKLAQDIINEYPFHALEVNGEQFQTKYSILVEQYALTEEAYEYWQQLKKSTESIGSLFDAQPSQVTSNISCTSNPGLPVVGYFSAGTVQQKRIFIKVSDLPIMHRASFYDDCMITFLPVADVPTFNGYYLIFTADYDRGGQLTGYETAPPWCVDCRAHGGTTVMPDFWK